MGGRRRRMSKKKARPSRRKPKTALKRKRDTRPSAARRGYGHAWTKRRAAFLKGKKRCSKCGRGLGRSPHVHHSGKGLRALCASCHNGTSAKNKARNNRRGKIRAKK